MGDGQPCYGDERELPEEPALAQAAALLSAAANPTRLLVLLALRRRGPLSAGTLAQLAGVEQSAMSHQLRVLRQTRLVRTERRGKRVMYQLVDDHVAHIVEDALRHAVAADCEQQEE